LASKSADQPSIQTHSQDIIDRNLIKEKVWVLRSRDWLSVRKSLDKSTGRHLIKFTDGLDLEDLKKIRTDAGCQLKALELDSVLVDLILVKDPERAVRLVCTELEYFQARLYCQQRQSEATGCADEQGHIKWFDIPKDVALESARLWCDFVNKAYNSNGGIKHKWVQMIIAMFTD
jgi:hypothetical protein